MDGQKALVVDEVDDPLAGLFDLGLGIDQPPLLGKVLVQGDLVVGGVLEGLLLFVGFAVVAGPIGAGIRAEVIGKALAEVVETLKIVAVILVFEDPQFLLFDGLAVGGFFRRWFRARSSPRRLPRPVRERDCC